MARIALVVDEPSRGLHWRVRAGCVREREGERGRERAREDSTVSARAFVGACLIIV